ncbi:MAG: exopolysaccharide biosynthesis polyprenyl glycosylphosphotransferase [Armatimonadetes bacterium]|nr:exopolysaccharide biosynthesis polyprenyl glycosylphosphotransferase [Armatimonadota bacterium]
MAAHPQPAEIPGVVTFPCPVVADEALAYRWAKRVLDVIGAVAGLVLLAPLMLLVALAIKLESRGPVFFCQRRLGQGGVPFRFYKFRSMTVGAEQARCELEQCNEVSGPVFKMRQDPRTTRVGRFIRRASIDEMPQLWNVLRGDMSLVGPRPPLPDEVACYEQWQRERLAVRPGLTCIWQVSGRSDVPFEEWVRMDIEYVRTRSFWLDLKLLALTVPAVLSGRGAY